MKVVVLCGGYGTRLVRDVINDPSQEFKHLVNVPKALLPVGDCSLLTHWVKIFQNIPEIEHLCIETNDVFFEKFEKWASEWPNFVSVVNDKSSSNATRLGAVAAIQYAVDYFDLNEDIIVVAGDTLFFNDVDVSAIICHFIQLITKDSSASLVTVYDCDKDGYRFTLTKYPVALMWEVWPRIRIASNTSFKSNHIDSNLFSDALKTIHICLKPLSIYRTQKHQASNGAI